MSWHVHNAVDSNWVKPEETFMLRQIGLNEVWVSKLMGDQMGQCILQGHGTLSNTWTLDWGTMHKRVLFCLLCCYFISDVTQNGHKGQAVYFRDKSFVFPTNVSQIRKIIQYGLTHQFFQFFHIVVKLILHVIHCHRATKVSYSSTMENK